MAFVTLEDLEGTTEITLWPETFALVENLLASEEPLLVKGKLEGDEKFSKNQIEDAEKHYAKALQMDPGNWKDMHSLAEVRFQLKKYKATKLSSKVFISSITCLDNLNFIFFSFSSSNMSFFI